MMLHSSLFFMALLLGHEPTMAGAGKGLRPLAHLALHDPATPPRARPLSVALVADLPPLPGPLLVPRSPLRRVLREAPAGIRERLKDALTGDALIPLTDDGKPSQGVTAHAMNLMHGTSFPVKPLYGCKSIG